MHIATLIPIARGIPFDTLTYYSSEALLPGTLVTVPFGKQTIPGIVTTTVPLAEAKSMVKHASFTLKKIKTVSGHIPFFEHLIKALTDASTQTLVPIGAIASSLIPQAFFEYVPSEKIPDIFSGVIVEQGFSEHAIAGTSLSRGDKYKPLIRSAFAEHKSVLFIAPSILALSKWKAQLEKGIQKHVLIFHSKLTKKEQRANFAALKQSDRPLLIFTTPGYMVLPRADIGIIISEQESSNLYKTSDRFEFDTRYAIKYFAEHAGIELIWGDTIPRFETLARCDATHVERTFIPEKLHVVPIEQYRTILPTETMDLIRHAETKKRRLFIYTNRKGVAPLSRCSDCGTIVMCESCGLPMILRNRTLADGSRERYFVCSHCTATLPATHNCTHCGGWNITPVSIGTDSIYDAIVALVGNEHVIAIDDDLTPDAKTIEGLFEKIEKSKFAIVVGTQKAIPYLKNIHYTIIPFFDRLLSIPSLYTTETVLRLTMECNEVSSDGVIICTKNPTFPIIRQLETQKINALIADELNVRKELGYPPYGTLIRITVTAPVGHREKIEGEMQERLKEFDATMLPARRVSLGSMKVALSWLIRAESSFMEEYGEEFSLFLERMRYTYKIEQNPERL